MVDWGKGGCFMDSLFLSHAEQAAFDKFKTSDSAALSKDEYKLLLGYGLVEKSLDGSSGWFESLPDSGECRLSRKGIAFRSYQQAAQKRKRLETIRYTITTTIAVIALILSAIAIAAELGLMQFPPA